MSALYCLHDLKNVDNDTLKYAGYVMLRFRKTLRYLHLIATYIDTDTIYRVTPLYYYTYTFYYTQLIPISYI